MVCNRQWAQAMSNGYLPSLHPTFTQGFILGQLSVLVLLVLILKYLFLDSTKSPFETSSYHPRVNSDVSLRNQHVFPPETDDKVSEKNAESMEWLSLLMQQVGVRHLMQASSLIRTFTRWSRHFAPACATTCPGLRATRSHEDE